MFLKKARFIPLAAYSPYENMAIDEYLISYYERTKTPVLRLYSWRPNGISIGRNQNAQEDLDLNKCRAAKVPVVRRLTGGGAIFHGNELTYSIVCSEQDLSIEKNSVKRSFEILNQFILNMYSKFGFEAGFSKDVFFGEKKHGLRHGFCFAGNEEYDIIIKGRKIGGNAQYRRKKLIFQHGSVPLGNEAGAKEYFKCPVDGSNYTCLNTLLGREVTAIEAAANLTASFMETFDADLKEEPFNIDEKREIVGVLTTKYAADNWNLKKV
jgi:lipoate-protein ligase A